MSDNNNNDGLGKWLKFMAGFAIVAFALSLMLDHGKNANDINPAAAANGWSYTQFIEEVRAGRIETVVIQGDRIAGQSDTGDVFSIAKPDDSGLMGDLINNKVDVYVKEPEKKSILLSVFLGWTPIFILIGVWIYFMKKQSGGGGGFGGFGKNKAKLLSEESVKVKLKDVAGIPEAKEEVGELIHFLENPEKFTAVGGKIPRGVLMVGPPGTGKTLMAKAIAGEAGVPFFSISGSDFVEMFVGVGASRVRNMFAEAKKKAPCIVFIDEIDAMGKKRGGGMGGSNDEREQTLNQMLVEMDGFEGNEGIIVIAATNRSDVLDPALLRPGRFDRQVTVGLPDLAGREQILDVHMKKVPIGKCVEAKTIARGTPGFSGADLANLVNEAALFVAREDRKMLTMEDFEKAKDKIMMGAERRSMIMSEEEKRLTAYHEAGHAIVGLRVPSHDPVHKVSIIPRGRALGVTLFLPENDRVSYSKQRLESQMASLYGGRVAEQIIYGDEFVTTGASNDLERATNIAKSMIMKWGFSEKLGQRCFEDEQHNPYAPKGHADTTSDLIDAEIKHLIDTNYQRATDILNEDIDILHAMAEALMKYETIDAKQIDDLMNGAIPRDSNTIDTSVKSSSDDDDKTPEVDVVPEF